MAITRQVITSLGRDGTDILGTKVLAVKIVDESIVSGSLLTVESIRAAGVTCAGVVLNPGPETTAASDLASRTNGALVRDLLGLPLLELDRLVQTAGKIPVWLGGE